MPDYEFYTLDVFADKPFSGNPLAVFPSAQDIAVEVMQQIASEFNLSETVFVLDSEKALKRLRIFTPQQELPLAGHPVVGTWNLLARLGMTPTVENGTIEIKQELNLGVLPVVLEFKDGEIATVEMEQARFKAYEEIKEPSEIGDLAAALGLTIGDIGNSHTSLIQVVSTGIRSLAIPVWSMESLRKIKVRPDRLADIYGPSGAVGCYTFCFDTVEPDSLVHARFFAPADGIPEDPATGSAAGALSGHLVHNGIVEQREFTIEQGDIMGRPGRIFARVEGDRGDVRSVNIKGTAVPFINGTMTLP
ncbi:MAG: PhzF family phenazine biosynthesis protein [Acidobacteriota bacterium]|nr:PhzF family phenazine biosynthesis protein [Acidobacteriota bacterium]MDH3530207.1 PhzF family phenazine biosynthesis protein [Acidobacteriota bacterium]